MKPLPKGLPALPDGYVYLGTGGSFETAGDFEGLAISIESDWVRSARWGGRASAVHYAAPKDSEVARLNAPKLTSENPAQSARDAAFLFAQHWDDLREITDHVDAFDAMRRLIGEFEE